MVLAGMMAPSQFTSLIDFRGKLIALTVWSDSNFDYTTSIVIVQVTDDAIRLQVEHIKIALDGSSSQGRPDSLSLVLT